ncbi:reductase [Paenibacillus peoriae]|uniref:NAD-dependent epimerase/dehydratase family protein n=1 Tax=Paenibacillus peoriae TaxID=59893 RepID=UPI000CECC397|nr:NAD(P)-dependent oxidoreductase [Paenibacillus peoriae]PPQ46052.1 reductase [Paenibacillus peoriae]
MEKKRAVVIGATGQIGRAAVDILVRDGWDVTAVSRSGGKDENWPDEVKIVRADRNNDEEFAAAIGDGCDVVVDVVAYGAAHARQLTAMADRIGSAVVLSTTVVYEDDKGRNFDTAREPDGFPHLPVPIHESQRTVQPGETTYSTGKIAMEQELLAAGDRLPITVLRAGAVYGPYSSFPYELYFVKRNLDGRRKRVLDFSGEGLFHRVSVRTLAELIRLAAMRPGSRVLNACDPEVPTIAEIGKAIDTIMDVEVPETILIDGPSTEPYVGKTSWMIEYPMVCDMVAAEKELGYRPVENYDKSLQEMVEWLVEQLAGRDWKEAFPLLAQTHPHLFDYVAEDAWFTKTLK